MYKPLPILCYHEFSDVREEHFEYLVGQGFTTVHLDKVKDYLLHPDKNDYPNNKIVLTFDDAYQDFFDETRPLLQRFGFTATVGVPTRYVSDSAGNPKRAAWHGGPGSPTMTWLNLEQLVAEDFEIASHSINHIPFIDETFDFCPELFRCEIQCSKHILESKLRTDVGFFVFPHGAGWGRETLEVILREAGYAGALRTQPEDNDDPPGWDHYSIPRWLISSDTVIEEVLKQIDTFGKR